MQGDVLYFSLSKLLDAFIWGGELFGDENLPEHGPAVFISNHALALGPIAVTSSMPMRLFPWAIGDMLDWDKAPAYLNRDFVEPQLHLPPPLSLSVSRLLSQISVRLLRGIGCIPTYHGEEVLQTYRLSLDCLEHGRILLIFPEDPALPRDDQCHMSPFMKGFTRLGEIYYQRTGQILKFFPIAVHPILRQVKLGRPISFNPHNQPANERVRLKSVLESMIRSMLLEMTLKGYAGIPQPH